MLLSGKPWVDSSRCFLQQNFCDQKLNPKSWNKVKVYMDFGALWNQACWLGIWNSRASLGMEVSSHQGQLARHNVHVLICPSYLS